MRITLNQAKDLLLSSEVIAIPTETVYGLAAIYSDVAAIKKIYALKKRPLENPLIMHIYDSSEIKKFTHTFPKDYEALANAFWPGPLTLVLKVIENQVPDIIRAGLPTQAFRVPSHPLTLDLLKKTGPLVAPSANLSGRPSSVSEDHVENDFGFDFPVLSGGPCTSGVESTILIFEKGFWKIGRLGALSKEAFQPILGYIPEEVSSRDPLICPGQKFRHYAPKAKLYLTKKLPEKGIIIGFSDRKYPNGVYLISLGSSQNPKEALSNLYHILRRLDQDKIQEAYIDIEFPEKGLWLTLKERLIKASNS